jgi:hypothetical protein
MAKLRRHDRRIRFRESLYELVAENTDNKGHQSIDDLRCLRLSAAQFLFSQAGFASRGEESGRNQTG